MIDIIMSVLISPLLAGLSTPLLAVCVLPLYPGYLAFLANQKPERQIPARTLGFPLHGVIVKLNGTVSTLNYARRRY